MMRKMGSAHTQSAPIHIYLTLFNIIAISKQTNEREREYCIVIIFLFSFDDFVRGYKCNVYVGVRMIVIVSGQVVCSHLLLLLLYGFSMVAVMCSLMAFSASFSLSRMCDLTSIYMQTNRLSRSFDLAPPEILYRLYNCYGITKVLSNHCKYINCN